MNTVLINLGYVFASFFVVTFILHRLSRIDSLDIIREKFEKETDSIEEDSRPHILKKLLLIFSAINIIGYFTLSPDGFMALSSGMFTFGIAFSPIIVMWMCE